MNKSELDGNNGELEGTGMGEIRVEHGTAISSLFIGDENVAVVYASTNIDDRPLAHRFARSGEVERAARELIDAVDELDSATDSLLDLRQMPTEIFDVCWKLVAARNNLKLALTPKDTTDE